MKIKLLVVWCIALLLTNCAVSDDSNTEQNYKNLWHLINVSGGVAGVNENFELETIIWSFDEATSKLTVENNNQDDTIQDGIESGIYNYSITSGEGGRSYLTVETNEFGLLTFSQNGMSIDGNQLSTGDVADGFMYSFQIQVVIAD